MIAELLYKNPRILLLAIAVIVVAGISSFLVMPRLEDPVLGRRVALVSTVFPGANAERVESLVTIPLEETLHGIARIKQVRSNSRHGISNLVIELEDDVYDVEPVWTLIRNRISDVQPTLPETCHRSELQVVPLKAFASIIAIQSNSVDQSDLSTLRTFARKLRSRLLAISGTEHVTIFGDPGEEYLIEIEPETLVSTGLSNGEIAQQIRGHRAEAPSGRLFQDGRNLSLGVQGDAAPVDRLASSLITFGPDRESVPLSEIATVEKRLVEPPSNLAIIDGRPAIVLGAMVSDELRVDEWANRLDQTLTEFEKETPEGGRISILFSQRQHIDARMQILWKNLGIGTAAVMFVVLLLMGWRSMLVVAAALPLSAMLVLAAMRALSIPIHQMSVTGLIIALGLLIDNAIVIVEDVRTRIVNGASPVVAITGGVKHLAVPLFGSTLTTVLAFLPIALLPGPPGEFVGTIAVSVILAISASFVLSMTVIPALISLLRIPVAQRRLLSYGMTIGWLQRCFESSLRFIFRVPVLGVQLGILLPVTGYLAARDLPEQFFPASDYSQIQIELELPLRDTIQLTRDTVDSVRAIVATYDEVDRQHWFLGGSAPTFYYNVVPRRQATPNYAQAFVDLKRETNIRTLVRSLQEKIDEEIPQGRVIVRQLEQGPPFDAPVELRIIGPELSRLQQLGSDLRVRLGQTSNVLHTRSDLEETIPRLSFRVDSQAAQQGGLDESQVSRFLYTTLEGAAAGKIHDDDEELPVRVRVALDGPLKQERLVALPLPAIRGRRPLETSPVGEITGSGPPVSPLTLGSLTTSQVDSEVGAIIRIQGRRANEVKAYIRAGVLPSTVLDELKANLAASDFELPDGYTLEFGGETEQRTNAVNKLIANGTVLFALMVLTLVASFGSFRCAMIIAVVGGLSAGLGPLALLLFGYPFGFMAIVGTMGLVGVAINDSIVVLAAIRSNAESRNSDVTGVVAAVSGCARHIIATTLTTILAFLPLILSGGGFWPPLAITIAGGVGGATFLALYFVPSAYLLLFRRPGAASVGETTTVQPAAQQSMES